MKISFPFLCPAAAVLWGATLSAADAIAFRPFVIDHHAATPAGLDLSFLLDGPAGATGRIKIADGHLVKPDGTRFRIWGVNITAFAKGSIHFPEKEDADFWADRLARLGVNCVRLHSFDEPAPRGIIAADRDDTRSFDAEQLDRMDRFVAALKQRGIYVNLNLNVGRSYQPGDGVRDAELMGYAKAVTYFDPRLLELQREYARALLTHFNPYTKSTYAEEPAVAIVEILNENSLVGAWIRGRLQGTKTSGAPENWQDIPPYYAEELTKLYNDWLAATQPAEKLAELRRLAGVAAGAPVPRLAGAELAAAPRVRFTTEAAFYMDVEEKFYASMRRFLREELRTEALLIGTSDFSYGRSFYPTLRTMAQLDIIDTHGPWEQAPMVDEPENSIPVRASRSAVAGKPLVVSEHNHRFPSDYTAEGIPLLAAYAAFQDWDGIFLYTFEVKPPGYAGRIESRADISHDPVKLANLAAGALIFARADVSAARETVARTLSAAQVVDSLLLPVSAGGVYFTPGFSPGVALRHGSRLASFDGAPTATLSYPPESPVVSDTRELSWYYTPAAGAATLEDDQRFTAAAGGAKRAHSGVVTVDAPRTQALLGFLNTRDVRTAQLSAKIENPFACLVLSSLDGKPIAQSSRLLLAATARVKNTGTPSPVRTKQPTAVDSPTLIEPVTGTVTLRGLAGASAVYVAPLDGGGNPASHRSAQNSGDAWQFSLGDTATTWFEISVKRK